MAITNSMAKSERTSEFRVLQRSVTEAGKAAYDAISGISLATKIAVPVGAGIMYFGSSMNETGVEIVGGVIVLSAILGEARRK
jgi:hypothetical protein